MILRKILYSFFILIVCLAAAGEARTVIAGDRLRVTVAEQPDLNRVYPVAGDGTLDFPMLGRVRVADLEIEEAEALLKERLQERFFNKATVNMAVAEFVEGSIHVLGSVQSPGLIPFRTDQMLTLVEAITMQGGLASGADGSHVRIIRWSPDGSMQREVSTVDVKAMFESLDFSNDQFLRPRDMIYVPSLGSSGESSEYLVLGEVNNAGFHPYEEGMDMIRAVSKAGGVNRYAKLEASKILRPTGAGEYSSISVDLARLFGGADMTMNLSILPGDIIFVPSASMASQGKYYLLGEVNTPGAQSLPSDGQLSVAKAILSTGGMTQYANADKVKLIRTAPDGSKQTLRVDVDRILSTGEFDDDIPLQNGDVIIVPERILF